MKRTAENCITPGCCTCPGMPRCPNCGYTAHDAAHLMDHSICDGAIPDDQPRWTPGSLADVMGMQCGPNGQRWADAVERLAREAREIHDWVISAGYAVELPALQEALEAAEEWKP